MGTEVSWKDFVLWRETGRSPSAEAGNMDRVDWREGRVGSSGSEKLKLKVCGF
jgi:hypothetical protein